MNKLVNDVSTALMKLHQETDKEWIHLKEIYKQVELIRNKKNPNNGASIRATLEKHSKKSKIYNGLELFVLKEKGTGLYKLANYDNIRNISTITKKIKKIEDNISVSSIDDKLKFVSGTIKIRKYTKMSDSNNNKIKNKRDYIAEEIVKNKQGIINEQVIFNHELKRLQQKGMYELAKKMKKFFEEKTDSEGFDILTFELRDNNIYEKKYIEVKSTKGDESTPIDITDNELEFASKHKNNYYIYRIIKCESKDRYIKIIDGKELFEKFKFVPTKYKIFSK